jgi:hypothetical protein
MNMEAICSSEMSAGFQGTTRRYILEDSTLRKKYVLHLYFYKTKITAEGIKEHESKNKFPFRLSTAIAIHI